MTWVRARFHDRCCRDDERGISIIFLAMFLVILLIMAAIVVDVGNARQQRANAQSAVDAASLSAAQILQTTQSSQTTNVFNMAANTVYNSLYMHPNFSAPTGTCSANGSGATPPAVCNDYQYTSGGIAYDVQVTTPYVGPSESVPDTSMINVLTCWGVPAVFGKVIGTNSIPVCANATAQNGVAIGGSGDGGCGTSSELTNITDNFSNSSGPYQISAVYNTTSGTNLPIDTSKIHFVVQTQYGNFIQIPEGSGGSGVAGVSYSMSPASGGNNVTLTYQLPSTIIPNGSAGSAYSNTFSANLQVTDTAGRNCGNASWTTCNPPAYGSPAHDPIFDGGSINDVGNYGWGLNGVASQTDDSGGDTDGHDLNTAADADDTVTPPQGSVINAGTPIGAIYNDENALRAASVSFIVDGSTVAYSSSWTDGKFTFADPSTMTSSGSGPTPTLVSSVPSFGSVDNNVSTVGTNPNNGLLQVTLFDTMGNPMPGESVTVSGVSGSQTTALDGTANFAWPPTGTQTVSYSSPAGSQAPSRPSGSFTFTVSSGGWWGGSTASKTTSPLSSWPSNGHTKGVGSALRYWGSSVGVMYKTPSSFVNGWHAAVLFANDGDVNTQGGDCSIISWAFASTGGTNAPGILHLVT